MNKTRNPYIDEDGVPKLLKSVVAFIDVLGYSDLIKRAKKDSKSQELLLKLHAALKKAQRYVNPETDSISEKSLTNKNCSAFRSFTDNIVIGHPIKDDGEFELGRVFSELSYFQLVLTIEGFFVRGAISIGDLYMDDIVVFGSGLTEAYEAEHELSRDPRIILSLTAKKSVDQHIQYYSEHAHAPQNRNLLRDSDGQYFVNYLDTLLEEGDVYEEELQSHKEIIENRLVEYKNRPPIWSKYMWAAKYHNYFCDENRQINKNTKIDTTEFSLKPARIVNLA